MPISTIKRNGRSSIRRSTDADIEFIHSWVIEEDALGIPGSFLCNWSLTEECHREGKLLVFVEGKSGFPVAYQWGGLIRPGILQVRHDMRGKGIGRNLVARCIANAYRHDECMLYIECNPASSIPFWKAMDFELLDRGGDNHYAFRTLNKAFALPPNAHEVHVEIGFYPESRRWNKTVPPLVSASPAAARAPDDTVHLAERVFFFEALYPNSSDAVIEIEIDGQRLFGDKAKYPAATRIGVRCCTNGYYIDKIFPTPTRGESNA